MLTGFTAPYSETGHSSLVLQPPWHYAGRIMSFGADVDPNAAGRFLPETFGHATGRAYGHFCEWQATTDGWELLDPSYAQYEEFFYLIEVEKDGILRLFCPFIYVTQDISMVRGHMQGWPKKMGSVWMTRSYGLDHPASGRLASGTQLAGTLAVKDRRLAEARMTLSGKEREPIGFLATPTYGLVTQATLIGGADAGKPTLVRQDISDKIIGRVYAAEGELTLFAAPRDEVAEIVPLRTTDACLCEFALSVNGVVEERS